jgi:hypothetical protein
MAFRKRTLVLTTTGSAGSAVATGTIPVPTPGVLHAVTIDYHASAPATTDVTIKDGNASGATLVTIANTNTDFTLTPVGKTNKDNAWGAGTTAAGAVVFHDGIYIDVAQCDALTAAVTITVVVEN